MSSPTESLLCRIRSLAADAHGPTDADLLQRFVRHRDELAFTTLVRRHGSMVLRVCRRVLVNPADAEDALQATFLVLARKAASVQPAGALPAWLHGVAYHAALKTRRATRRRAASPLPADCLTPDRRDPLEELSVRECLGLLDEEVARLPEVYRLPIVLCCLEGLTQEEAAARLGWSAGSVKGRLERGRVRLHARLTRRGLTLAAALGCLEAAYVSAAAVPAALIRSSVVALSAAVDGPDRLLPGLDAIGARQAILMAVVGSILLLGLVVGGLMLQPPADDAPRMPAPPAEEPPKAAERDPRPEKKPDASNYLVLPVETDLQRTCLPVQVRKANVCVLLNGPALIKDDAVLAKNIDFGGLREALKPYHEDREGAVLFHVFLNSHSPADDLLAYALSGFAREHARFRDATTVRNNQGRFDWQQTIDAVNRKLTTKTDSEESGERSGDVTAYPVRTALSRYLLMNVDCVVDIEPAFDKDSAGKVTPAIEKAIRTAVGKLMIPDKGKLLFRVTHTESGKEAASQFHEAAAKELAESLGFQRQAMQSRGNGEP